MPILIKGSGGVQKTPTITVSSNGLITATAGKKSATKQLSSSHDSDFVAANIKNGTNIFGVTGTFSDAPSVYIGEIRGESTGTLHIPISSASEILSLSVFATEIYENSSKQWLYACGYSDGCGYSVGLGEDDETMSAAVSTDVEVEILTDEIQVISYDFMFHKSVNHACIVVYK